MPTPELGMRYLLARPYPDELLGSVWVRTAKRLQLPIALLTRVVSGEAKGRPGLFHVGNLRAMASGLRVSPRWLLWHHTVFPYATAFYKAELLDRAVASAMSTGPVARTVGPILQSVSDYSRLRRFCHFCAQDELATLGESYWHREHNLPGVLVCLRHESRLVVTSVAAVSTRWQAELPEDLMAAAGGHGPRQGEGNASGNENGNGHRKPSDFMLELARRSSALAMRDPYTVLRRDPSWYREAFEALGLVSRGRQLDSSGLVAWLGEHLGDAAALGLPARDQDLRWAAHMLRPGYEAPFVSFKHQLLEVALRLQRPVATPVLNHVPAGFQGLATPEADKRFARAVRRLVKKYVALGERVRVQDLLTEAGCWSRYRHTRDMYPFLAREVERLKASAVAVRPNWGKGTAARGSAEPTKLARAPHPGG